MALLSRSEYGTLQVRIKARLDEASAFDCDGWWFDGRSIINKPYGREVAVPVHQDFGYYIATVADPSAVIDQCTADLLVLDRLFFKGDIPDEVFDPIVASLKARYPMTLEEFMHQQSLGR